jgi:transposase
MDTRQPYPSDLTHAEWSQVRRFIPAPKPGGRPAKHDRREIVHARLSLNRTGCPWRALPHDFPPWGTVPWYFRIGQKDGTFDRLLAERRGDLRVVEGHQRQPSAAILDSQSVMTTESGGHAAMTLVRTSTVASGLSWSTPSACSSPWWGTRRTSRTRRGRSWSSSRSAAGSAG